VIVAISATDGGKGGASAGREPSEADDVSTNTCR